LPLERLWLVVVAVTCLWSAVSLEGDEARVPDGDLRWARGAAAEMELSTMLKYGIKGDGGVCGRDCGGSPWGRLGTIARLEAWGRLGLPRRQKEKGVITRIICRLSRVSPRLRLAGPVRLNPVRRIGKRRAAADRVRASGSAPLYRLPCRGSLVACLTSRFTAPFMTLHRVASHCALHMASSSTPCAALVGGNHAA